MPPVQRLRPPPAQSTSGHPATAWDVTLTCASSPIPARKVLFLQRPTPDTVSAVAGEYAASVRARGGACACPSPATLLMSALALLSGGRGGVFPSDSRNGVRGR